MKSIESLQHEFASLQPLNAEQLLNVRGGVGTITCATEDDKRRNRPGSKGVVRSGGSSSGH